MLLVIMEESEFCVDGSIIMTCLFAVLLYLSLEMACSIAVLFTAGEGSWQFALLGIGVLMWMCVYGCMCGVCVCVCMCVCVCVCVCAVYIVVLYGGAGAEGG